MLDKLWWALPVAIIVISSIVYIWGEWYAKDKPSTGKAAIAVMGWILGFGIATGMLICHFI